MARTNTKRTDETDAARRDRARIAARVARAIVTTTRDTVAADCKRALEQLDKLQPYLDGRPLPAEVVEYVDLDDLAGSTEPEERTEAARLALRGIADIDILCNVSAVNLAFYAAADRLYLPLHRAIEMTRGTIGDTFYDSAPCNAVRAAVNKVLGCERDDDADEAAAPKPAA